jgi:hypothetical protein
VSAGKYSTSILLPAKIPFGDSAQFKAYAWDPATRRDGGAVVVPRIMAGVGKDIPTTTTGPTLSIRPCDSSWTAGLAFGKLAQVPLPFCLEVDMRDSFGISSDQGPDEGVVFTLVGVKDPWHPDLHQGVDYHSAYAQLNLDSTLVQPGNTYTFQVSARDLMGNLSKATLQIQPQAQGQYALYEVFNSPNPVRDGGGTTFYFKLSSGSDTGVGNTDEVDTRIQSSIRIHTISGKLVRILRTDLSQAQPRPRATWDLRDSFGRPVANGLYPYAVTLRIPDATGTTTQDLVKRGNRGRREVIEVQVRVPGLPIHQYPRKENISMWSIHDPESIRSFADRSGPRRHHPLEHLGAGERSRPGPGLGKSTDGVRLLGSGRCTEGVPIGFGGRHPKRRGGKSCRGLGRRGSSLRPDSRAHGHRTAPIDEIRAPLGPAAVAIHSPASRCRSLAGRRPCGPPHPATGLG